MDEADALGLELVGAHREDQLGASACSEDECDAGAGARVTARGGDEIVQCGSALAARETAAMVGILAAGGSRAIRRIRDDEVEAGGLEAGNFFLAKVRAKRMHRVETVERRVARDHLGERWLDFERYDFARLIKRRHHDRYDTASGAKLEHSIARGRARKAAEQNRFDREAVTVPRLDQRDRSVEDRIASFVIVG